MEYVRAMPDVLAWTDPGGVLGKVSDQYTQSLSTALGYLIATISRSDPSSGDELAGRVRDASSAALLRVLLAPQSAHFLLWQRPETLDEASEFFRRSLLAEEVREGKPANLRSETWTALGDAVVLPTGEVRPEAPQPSLMPLDLDSPYVTSADPLGRRHDSSPWRPISSDHRDVVLQRLVSAQRGLALTSPVISAFVGEFTKVLVLQEIENATYFSSYSVGQYIGRSVISNPHLADEALLAEALVHEAIHSLLYMQSQHYPWGMDVQSGEYDDTRTVPSPWTGKDLPVSTFLHACHVWYGVLQFWSLALSSNAFPARRVRGRMARAALGFLGQPLIQLIPVDDREAVAADVGAVIDEMQARVAASMPDAASAGRAASTS